MANFTEKAIRRVFLEMLEERPLNKITVKDIAEKCEISRNSFYYHYKDIPSLLESITKDEFDDFVKMYSGFVSLGDVVTICLQFATKNRQAILNIYRSDNRDVYENHLWRLCEHVSRSYFGRVEGVKALSEENKELLIRLFKCELYGVIAEWVWAGMRITRNEANIDSCIDQFDKMKLAEIDVLVAYLTGSAIK